MEYLSGGDLYLLVKIECQDIKEYGSLEQKLPFLQKYRDAKRNLLTLVFNAEDIDSTLSQLLRLYPDARIIETSLTTTPEQRGYLKPISNQISIVCPGPGITPNPGQIIINSSLSFGSGFHPTTELCIKLIEKAFVFKKIEHVFDLGTGSGVLALVVVSLGAQIVLAADIDFRACLEAKENVIANRNGVNVFVVCGSYSCTRHNTFDLLLANLTISTIHKIGGFFPPLLKPGGLMVLSGFTNEQAEHVRQSIGQCNVIEQLSLEGWSGMLVEPA